MPTRLCVSQWLLTSDSSAFLWNGQCDFLKYHGPVSSACLKATPCVPDNLFGSLLVDNHCVIPAYLWLKSRKGSPPLVDLNIQTIYVKERSLALMETSAYSGYLVQERYAGLQPWRTLNITIGKGIQLFINHRPWRICRYVTSSGLTLRIFFHSGHSMSCYYMPCPAISMGESTKEKKTVPALELFSV